MGIPAPTSKNWDFRVEKTTKRWEVSSLELAVRRGACMQGGVATLGGGAQKPICFEFFWEKNICINLCVKNLYLKILKCKGQNFRG